MSEDKNTEVTPEEIVEETPVEETVVEEEVVEEKPKKPAAKKPAKKEKLFYSPTSGAALTARPDGTFVDPKTNEVFTEAYINEVSNDEIATAQVNVNPDTSNEALVSPQPVSNFAGAPNGDNSGKIFAS